MWNLLIIFLFGLVFTYPLRICINKFALNKLKIKPRYPFINILNGLLFVLIYINLGLNIYVSIYYIFLSVVLFLVYIDILYKIVPDRINLFLLALGILNIFLYRDYHYFIVDSIKGMFIISVPLLLIGLFSEGFGGGDIKLFAVCGLLSGTQVIFMSAILTIITAAIYATFLICVKRKDRKYQLALVPFIFIGLVLSILYSDSMVPMFNIFL